MGFPQKIADEVLIRCGRHCCLCDVYAGSKIELHHIKQVADGGEDTADNCIPLCLNCHAEVKAYNPHHPKGRKFTEIELRGHRDRCYAKYGICISTSVDVESAEHSIKTWFSKREIPQVPKMTWGFPDVDNFCALLPGTIALIAGYTAAGKSIYAQQTMLKNIARSNTVLYFHLKENSDTLLNNIIAAESATKLSNLQRQILTAEDWERISIALGTVNYGCLKLVPFTEWPPMADQVLTAAHESNADLIIVDDFNGLGLHDNAQIEEFLYRLKRIVAKTGSVVLILANIPQSIQRMDKRPMTQDIPNSALYHMCDIVQFLYREIDDYYGPSVPSRIEIIVVKNQGTNIIGTIELAALPDIPVILTKENKH